ncbi:hypothetical protein ScPMuIL_014751 [Solemya velum]
MAPQKRPVEEVDSLLNDVRVVLCDIEGTTTPLSFVKEKLEPYITENLESYLDAHYDEEEMQADVKSLRELAVKDKEAKTEGVVEIPDTTDSNKADVIKALVKNISWQMGQDRKSTELKQFQGHIWREAYKRGKVQAELFEDVAPAMQHLMEEGIMVCTYSSGSVDAQKLLFGHTTDGDLQELISEFFDTTVGPKNESDSYKNIVQKLAQDGQEMLAEEVIFLTDIPAEAAAAVKAGMKCALVERIGNPELTDEDRMNYPVIETFDELFGDDDEEDMKRLATEGNGDAGDDDDEDDDDDLGEEEEEGDEDEAEGEADEA